MKKKIVISLIFILPFMFACSSTQTTSKQKIRMPIKTTLNTPPFELVEISLAKNISIRGNNPMNKTDLFSADDTHVIVHVKMKNLSGKHTLKWKWYDPDGNLYYSTKDRVIETSYGKYRKEVSAWHKISIKGDPAARLHGNWRVDTFLDNKLLAMKNFKIDEDIENLPTFAARPNPKNWGLIIGIENYKNLPTVTFAEKDASLVREYFIRVLGIPEENITYLINNDATKATIEGHLKGRIPKNASRDGNFYVYYAGHGLPDLENKDAYLVPYDAEPLLIKYGGYKLESFYKDVENVKAKRTYVFLDTCFSGTTARGSEMLYASARPALIHVKNIKLLTGKVVSFSASEGGQISAAYTEKKHGLFTYYLLSGLKGNADKSDDGIITVEELHKYIAKNVDKIARRQGRSQNPTVKPNYDTIKSVSGLIVSKTAE